MISILAYIRKYLGNSQRKRQWYAAWAQMRRRHWKLKRLWVREQVRRYQTYLSLGYELKASSWSWTHFLSRHTQQEEWVGLMVTYYTSSTFYYYNNSGSKKVGMILNGLKMLWLLKYYIYTRARRRVLAYAAASNEVETANEPASFWPSSEQDISSLTSKSGNVCFTSLYGRVYYLFICTPEKEIAEGFFWILSSEIEQKYFLN